MSDPEARREAILLAALDHVAFDGWSRKALAAGAIDAGFAPAMARADFPGGAVEAIETFATLADRRMEAALGAMDLAALPVRARVRAGVKVRLEQNAPHREAVRRAVIWLALPVNAAVAAKTLYRTVDAIWRAAGDNATDYNFYTKRALLAGVYTSTLLCWLEDDSDGFAATWGFLDRRIDEVLRVPRAMARLGEAFGRIPTPFGVLRGASLRMRGH